MSSLKDTLKHMCSLTLRPVQCKERPARRGRRALPLAFERKASQTKNRKMCTPSRQWTVDSGWLAASAQQDKRDDLAGGRGQGGPQNISASPASSTLAQGLTVARTKSLCQWAEVAAWTEHWKVLCFSSKSLGFLGWRPSRHFHAGLHRVVF